MDAGASPSWYWVRGGVPVQQSITGQHRDTQHKQTYILTQTPMVNFRVNNIHIYEETGKLGENPRIHSENHIAHQFVYITCQTQCLVWTVQHKVKTKCCIIKREKKKI